MKGKLIWEYFRWIEYELDNGLEENRSVDYEVFRSIMIIILIIISFIIKLIIISFIIFYIISNIL